jgi:hypothetical protein
VGIAVPAGKVIAGLGVEVGGLAREVRDSPAWTVCATAVEIEDSSPGEVPHDETRSINPTRTAKILCFPSPNIQIPFS